jgi:quercetin dioxygenase-like cupin family protein
MSARPTLLTASADLATETTAELFHGREHGVGVSFFLNHTQLGRRTGEQHHPYPEVFIVHDGDATFRDNQTTLTAHRGQLVIVPAGRYARSTTPARARWR